MIEQPFKKPPPQGDHEPPPKPKRYWWRFTLASLVIVSVTAAATAASILLYVGSIAAALSHNDVLRNKVQRVLAQTNGGEPENIVILGSDKRASEPGDPGRSDTTILLRLDPDRNAIALMSIPRDLKVEIPGYGTGKFNEAFSYGGPKLTLRVVKELTGLPINHVVNVDYLGFVRAVDAIDCVYVDIDRRYYHSNVGVPASEQYAEIDVEPGYQLLCGKKALQYVRYRHTDTDLVRAARQQDFLSAARQRVPIADLVLGRNDLIEIFTEYTTSDISDKETMLEVMKLFIASRGASIKEVHFPAELGPSYVYASQSAIGEAVDKFLGIEASGGPRGSLDEGDGEAKGKSKKKHGKSGKRSKPKLAPLQPPGSDGLVPAAEAGLLEAKTVAPEVSHGFPVFYPARLPSGASYVESNTYLHVEDPRVYHFKDTDGKRHAAYRMTLYLSLPDGTHYFGVQGIKGWSDPPILANPSLTKTIHGREYDIFVDGDRVKLVAWRRGDNAYWISNTLLQSLTNDQMIGMARSARVIIPNRKPRRERRKAQR
ncbi:MAG TPA: LCP family protein [Solirubrobacterales bacterium]|jgi:LCP family protein required for cell wall assembly